MTELVVRPEGDIEVDGSVTIVGAGRVLSDQDNTTHATLNAPLSAVWQDFLLHPEVAPAISVEAHVIYTTASTTAASVVINATPPVGAAPGYAGIDTEFTAGTEVEWVHTLTDFDLGGDPFADFLARFVEGGEAPWYGANMVVTYSPGTTIHEMWLAFTLPDSYGIPPRRLLPNMAGAQRRLLPPPTSMQESPGGVGDHL